MNVYKSDGHGMTTSRERSGLTELLTRVQSEYREMPGLRLTQCQAERLWRVDRRTCAAVLATLIERRVLRRATDGAYLRAL